MDPPSSVTALCALCLATSLGLAAGVTPLPSGAFSTNEGVANQNGVHGGVLDLKLTETGPTNGEGSTTDESGVDVARDTWEDTAHDALGTDTISNTLELDTATSTVGADRVNVTIAFAENDSDADDGNAANTSRTIGVTAFEYGGTDLIGSELTDRNGNDRLDVEDLTLGSNAKNLSDRSTLAAGESVNLSIDLSGSADLIDGVGSGDGVDVTVTIRVYANSFTEADRSVDNTIQYA